MTGKNDYLTEYKSFLDSLEEERFNECVAFLSANSLSGRAMTMEEYLGPHAETLDDDDDDDEEYDEFDDPDEIDGEPTDVDGKRCRNGMSFINKITFGNLKLTV